MSSQRVVKPKNNRVKRALEKREPKIFENDKATLLLKGGNTNEGVTQCLKDVHQLKRTNAVLLQKKNITKPFEDQTSIEFLAGKHDASLFMFGSHSKKRPDNVVFGRLFDGHILDMAEFGITYYKAIKDFEGQKVPVGCKPCLSFSGEAFETNSELVRIRSLFIDFFRGSAPDKIRLQGLEHVISFTAVDDKICIRSYRIEMKKSGTRVPRVELTEIGPSLDLVTRRIKLASDDLYKRACRKPVQAKPKKTKNISRDAFGTKLGRIHMQSQDLSKLQLRKLKALKTPKTKPEKTPKDSEKEVGPPAKKRKEVTDE